MYGVAFEASYLLAKTEDISREYRTEEDNFVRAIEWGEKKGADILSASLGYTDWYEPSEMDGKTAVTTRGLCLQDERLIL